MGKTLRTIIAGSLILGSLLFLGCGKKEKTYERATNTYEETIKNPKQKIMRLEDYLIQDKEIGNIKLYSTDTPNPVIADIKDLGEEERKEYESNKIVRAGLGEYVLETENSSEKNLSLSVLEFESNQARKEFLEKNKEEIQYPIFVKDNIVSLIEKVTPKGTNSQEPFNEEQQIMYLILISNYVAKRGMEMISSKDEIEKVNMYETEKNEENKSESEIVSNPNSKSADVTAGNMTRESTNTATGGLEKYLFQGKELRLIDLSKENVSHLQFEEAHSLMIPYELYMREFSSNPVIIKKGGELWEGDTKEFFNRFKIEEFDWVAYKIPEREYVSKEHNLNLFLFKFEGEREAKEFLTRKDCSNRFPTFTKGNTVSIIYTPSFDFVYKYNMISNEQKIMYMDLVLDYRDRTGMELILSDDKSENESNLEFLMDLRKKYSWELRKN